MRITSNPRPPKVGELVTLRYQSHKVIAVYEDRKTADLQLLGSDYVEKEVPWGVYSYPDESG